MDLLRVLKVRRESQAVAAEGDDGDRKYKTVDTVLKITETILTLVAVIVCSFIEPSQLNFESTNVYLKVVVYVYTLITPIFAALAVKQYDISNKVALSFNISGAVLLGSCAGVALDVYIFIHRTTFLLLFYGIVVFVLACVHIVDITNRARSMTRIKIDVRPYCDYRLTQPRQTRR